MSGKVGVCIVTSGPGATNTVTGVADALTDSTPIVVIAGQVGISALGTDAFQEVDLACLAQPICKWSYQIRRPEDIAWAISRAFYIAKSGRPGPVVIDFPKNIQQALTEYEPQHIDFIRSYNAYPQPDEEKTRLAAELINKSKKPIALVGHGVEIGNAQEELKEFLEKADIPAARTLMGLSALPSDHPLNMGMLGMHGNYAPNIKEQECDLLIAIGMRFSDRVTSNVATYAKQAKIIHLDIDASEIDKNVKTDIAIVADCKESLPKITALVHKNSHKEWIDSFKPLYETERERVIEPAIHPKGKFLLMAEVVNAVAEATDDNTVMVNDVGQNQMIFQIRQTALVSDKRRTRHNGLRTACCHRCHIRSTWPHGVHVYRRRWIPDEHTGARHHYGTADTGEGYPAQQQLSRQCAPMARHVLRRQKVVHKDDEPAIRAYLQGLQHTVWTRRDPRGTEGGNREDAQHRRTVCP